MVILTRSTGGAVAPSEAAISPAVELEVDMREGPR